MNSKNILSSWICIDNDSNYSFFPSAGGKSTDKKIQNNYWKCLLVCLFSARIYNPSLRLVVFSNINILPIVDNVDFNLIFKKLDIEFYSTPFEFQTPNGYYGEWRNQFYEFSILKFIVSSSIFCEEDLFIMIDSDCVINNNLDDLYFDIDKYGSVNYEIDYEFNKKINGLSRLDLKDIYQKLNQTKLDFLPDYYGGEFFSAKVSEINKIMSSFLDLWPKLLMFHEQNLPVLNEEAHVLSYLYLKLGFNNNIANKYIKRLWTDPTTYRNIDKEDFNLPLWHLPAEKRFGFKYMFHFLSKYRFDTSIISPQKFAAKSKVLFSVSEIPLTRKIHFSLKYFIKKYIYRSN